MDKTVPGLPNVMVMDPTSSHSPCYWEVDNSMFSIMSLQCRHISWIDNNLQVVVFVHLWSWMSDCGDKLFLPWLIEVRGGETYGSSGELKSSMPLTEPWLSKLCVSPVMHGKLPAQKCFQTASTISELLSAYNNKIYL